MLDAIIFDAGGVLLRPAADKPLRLWERQLGLAEHTTERVIYGGTLGAHAMRGHISDDELWETVAQQFVLSAEQCAAFRQALLAAYAPDAALVAYIRGLRPRYRTAIISNAPSALRLALAEVYGIADAFDLIVCSAEEGVLKPDPEIYHRALARLKCAPRAAVLIDDRVENLASARTIGMHTIIYPTNDLHAELRKLGVEAAA